MLEGDNVCDEREQRQKEAGAEEEAVEEKE